MEEKNISLKWLYFPPNIFSFSEYFVLVTKTFIWRRAEKRHNQRQKRTTEKIPRERRTEISEAAYRFVYSLDISRHQCSTLPVSTFSQTRVVCAGTPFHTSPKYMNLGNRTAINLNIYYTKVSSSARWERRLHTLFLRFRVNLNNLIEIVLNVSYPSWVKPPFTTWSRRRYDYLTLISKVLNCHCLIVTV